MARHLRKLRALAETILVFAGHITRHNFRRRPGLRLLPKGHGGHEDNSGEHKAHCKALHGRLPVMYLHGHEHFSYCSISMIYFLGPEFLSNQHGFVA